MVLLLLVLPVLYCNDAEIEQLETQMQKLIVEKAQLRDVEDLLKEREELKRKLSLAVGLISNGKERQGVGELIKTSFEAIPGPVLLKEFFFSSGTLDFTLLFPSEDSLSTFLTNLERTKRFVRIETYPQEDRPKSEDTKYTEYTVICDYKEMPPPFEKQMTYESPGSRRRMTRKLRYRESVSTEDFIKMIKEERPIITGSGSRVDGLKSQIDTLQKEIRLLQGISRKQHEMREEVKSKREVLEKLKDFLPEQLDKEEVIKKIQTLASKSKIKITKCSKGKAKKMDFYLDVSFSIELTGGYRSIVNFIRMVEKQKAVFVVPEIYMTFPLNNIHSAGVNTSLTVTTFVQVFE